MELEISKRASEACDQVISEMGADIHDDLIQKFSIFRLYIDKLERSSGDANEIAVLATKMKSDFEQIIRSVKIISRKLLPTYTAGDSLIDMLEILCQNMEQPGIANILFERQGYLKSIEDSVQVYLLRIVQELIHNAVKHSFAWHIWVRVKSDDSRLTIEVEDDGTGATKIPEFIDRLKRKNNTLKMRTVAIGASIDYIEGSKGLLARVNLAHK